MWGGGEGGEPTVHACSSRTASFVVDAVLLRSPRCCWHPLHLHTYAKQLGRAPGATDSLPPNLTPIFYCCAVSFRTAWCCTVLYRAALFVRFDILHCCGVVPAAAQLSLWARHLRCCCGQQCHHLGCCQQRGAWLWQDWQEVICAARQGVCGGGGVGVWLLWLCCVCV